MDKLIQPWTLFFLVAIAVGTALSSDGAELKNAVAVDSLATDDRSAMKAKPDPQDRGNAAALTSKFDDVWNQRAERQQMPEARSFVPVYNYTMCITTCDMLDAETKDYVYVNLWDNFEHRWFDTWDLPPIDGYGYYIFGRGVRYCFWHQEGNLKDLSKVAVKKSGDDDWAVDTIFLTDYHREYTCRSVGYPVFITGHKGKDIGCELTRIIA